MACPRIVRGSARAPCSVPACVAVTDFEGFRPDVENFAANWVQAGCDQPCRVVVSWLGVEHGQNDGVLDDEFINITVDDVAPDNTDVLFSLRVLDSCGEYQEIATEIFNTGT